MPSRLQRTLDVVHINDVDGDAAGGPPTNDDGDATLHEEGRKRVGTVERDEHRAVEVAGYEVASELLLVVRRLGREEDEDMVGFAEHGVDPAYQTRKEGITEQLGRWLRD